jgi:N-acetyl-anhydromuramyl-L-alanine amidase AmpD
MPPSAIHVRPRQTPYEDIVDVPQRGDQSGFAWEPTAKQYREWRTIVIHHTAARHGSVESIHEAHLKRKDSNGNPWLGIGYHFVIGNGQGMSDGEIEQTFRWREQLQGAHAGAGEYNERGIGIALVGNFDEEPPTAAQLAAVKQLVSALQIRFGIAGDKVIGHSDIKATACPGRHFPIDEVRGGVRGAAHLSSGGRAAGVNLVGKPDLSLVAGQRSRE